VNDGCREVWKGHLDISGLSERVVSQDDLEDVISLMIDKKIDPSKFEGNLCALVSDGSRVLSTKDLFFPEETGRPAPTQSMTDEFIFGRPVGTPLWMLAAFPDVVNWLNDKMQAFHKTSKDESDEMVRLLALWGVESHGVDHLDESAFKNKDGQVRARYFRNLIDNYAKHTGNTFQTIVEHGSPNDIHLGSSLLSRIKGILFGH